MEINCLFCGSNVQMVFVHGHYQCPVCKTNALPCCDGDNCNNAFISKSLAGNMQENNSEDLSKTSN
jgi:hypothetical protein